MADKQASPRRIGFVGLGDQGGPMAMRMIEAGLAVTVWARRPEALDAYKAAGATVASDLAGLGAASDVVGVCVLDDAATLEVCHGLLRGMAAGSLLAIHSTVHPDTCRQIAALAAKSGVEVIDAPVSGGAAAAREGRLTVMIGGAPEAIAAYEPIMRAYAAVVARVGELGAGQLAKLVNNTLLIAHTALAQDAIRVGGGLGLDAKGLATVISASTGGSFAMRMIAAMSSPPSAEMQARGAKLLRKDYRLLMDVITGAGVTAGVMTNTASDRLEAMEAAVKTTGD